MACRTDGRGFIYRIGRSITPIYRTVEIDTVSIPSNQANYQEVPTIEGYIAISAVFVGLFTNGSRWIIGNPFLATDVNITLVRMFNNNTSSSSATGNLVVAYVPTTNNGIDLP